MRISATPLRHSPSDVVALRLADGAPLRASDAAAVASWYQSPRGHGAVFAALASGLPVDSGNLRAAIAAELRTAPAEQVPELAALDTWADVQTR